MSFVRRSAVALAFAACLMPAVALADPVGKYDVEGKGPDGEEYSGTVSVERTGETFRVVWLIGGEKSVGTAVGNDNFFAVSYKQKSDTGIAVYEKDADGWIGVWTYAGGRKMGTERFTRK
ncbi:hypothetical protein [Methyloraptor flagellatus]|jgi:hypothetical protein|uniref:Uncharacterized protein n=1 Tax=Methyloraptor flagellatus TaxID=3162530 RepID=A0AAU7XBH2_9HYPH